MTRLTPAAACVLLGAALLVGCPAPAAPVASNAPATLDTVQREVFSNCSTRSCHGDGGRGGLMLTSAEVSYAQLVNQPAQYTGAESLMRVKPGDPDASFLMEKLTAPKAGHGDLMPQRGAKLPDTTIDLVRRWIAAGCPK